MCVWSVVSCTSTHIFELSQPASTVNSFPLRGARDRRHAGFLFLIWYLCVETVTAARLFFFAWLLCLITFATTQDHNKQNVSATVSTVTVNVTRAQNLKTVQLIGTQDPYVKAKLLFDGWQVCEPVSVRCALYGCGFGGVCCVTVPLCRLRLESASAVVMH